MQRLEASHNMMIMVLEKVIDMFNQPQMLRPKDAPHSLPNNTNENASNEPKETIILHAVRLLIIRSFQSKYKWTDQECLAYLLGLPQNQQ